MANPERLLASADAALRRGHGAAVGRVPAGAGRATCGADGRRDDHRRRARAAGRLHARARLASRQLLRSASRVAFVGDTSSATSAPAERRCYVMPPTPPPDIDLEAWRVSEDAHPRVGSRHAVPDALRSVSRRPAAISAAARQHREWSRIVRRLIADRSLDEAQRQEAFVEEAGRDCDGRSESTGSGGLRPRRPARLLLAGALQILAETDLTNSGALNVEGSK